MANIKFSAFTTGATTANTRIVGYDSTGNTNNQYDASQLANFVLDGTLSSTRTLTMGIYDLTFASTTAGQQVKFAQNVEVEGQGFTTFHTGADITEINFNQSNVQQAILASGTNDFDITPTTEKAGATYILVIKQPAAGAAGTIDWTAGSATVTWPGGVAPTLTATNNSGASFYGSSTLDLK